MGTDVFIKFGVRFHDVDSKFFDEDGYALHTLYIHIKKEDLLGVVVSDDVIISVVDLFQDLDDNVVDDDDNNYVVDYVDDVVDGKNLSTKTTTPYRQQRYTSIKTKE